MIISQIISPPSLIELTSMPNLDFHPNRISEFSP